MLFLFSLQLAAAVDDQPRSLPGRSVPLQATHGEPLRLSVLSVHDLAPWTAVPATPARTGHGAAGISFFPDEPPLAPTPAPLDLTRMAQIRYRLDLSGRSTVNHGPGALSLCQHRSTPCGAPSEPPCATCQMSQQPQSTERVLQKSPHFF